MARMGFQWATTPRATQHPTTLEIAWAAGFLEGEGSFKSCNGRSEDIECSQVQQEPLERLQTMFGGSIGHYRNGRNVNHSPYHKWHVSGSRARGVMLTIYPLMSPKRQADIRRAFVRGG